MTVWFVVPGVPKPAGSKKSGVAHRRLPDGSYEPVRTADGRLKTFTKDDTGEPGKEWRADVRAAAEVAMEGRDLLTGPLQARIIFKMPRGAGHYGSGRNNGVLKPSAPFWHTVRPDVDKLSRAVLDALSQVVYEDDGQIVSKNVEKRYIHPGERAGAYVKITELAKGATALTDAAGQATLELSA